MSQIRMGFEEVIERGKENTDGGQGDEGIGPRVEDTMKVQSAR